jgi:trehalose-6-phosphatase
LFLDVDGTLPDFAERPHEVVTPAGLVAALAKAERKLEGAR